MHPPKIPACPSAVRLPNDVLRPVVNDEAFLWGDWGHWAPQPISESVAVVGVAPHREGSFGVDDGLSAPPSYMTAALAYRSKRPCSCNRRASPSGGPSPFPSPGSSSEPHSPPSPRSSAKSRLCGVPGGPCLQGLLQQNHGKESQSLLSPA